MKKDVFEKIGTYFFEGRKLDFSFVTVFYSFPSNFVLAARGPPHPNFLPHTTRMGPTKVLESLLKQISGLPAFVGVLSPDAVMH